MRFPMAGLFFLILAFLLFLGFVFGSYLLGTVDDAFADQKDELNSAFGDEVDLLIDAFGFFAVLSLIIGIVVFIVDSLADEPEYYWEDD